MIFFILIIWCEYHFALYQYQTESFLGYFEGDNKDDDCQDNIIIKYMNEHIYQCHTPDHTPTRLWPGVPGREHTPVLETNCYIPQNFPKNFLCELLDLPLIPYYV